jgi:hypothetical protein
MVRGDPTRKVAFRNPGAAWHPLRVMSRTDGTLTTLFHCVMALERVGESGGPQQEQGAAQVRVVWRAPQQSREYVKDLEENVVYQFLSTVATSTEAEAGALPPRYGVISYTLFDSKRFEGFYKSNADGSKFIVAISSLPLHSACRRIFELLDSDAKNLHNLCSIFTTLCEAPVLPVCGLVYELRFPCGRGLSLRVSTNEQFDDDDVFAVSLQVLNACWFSRGRAFCSNATSSSSPRTPLSCRLAASSSNASFYPSPLWARTSHISPTPTSSTPPCPTCTAFPPNVSAAAAQTSRASSY